MSGLIMCGFVILVGFLTASIGLVVMLAYVGSDKAETVALWAIVAALGVLQIGIGAMGSILADGFRKKLPPIPNADLDESVHPEDVDDPDEPGDRENT